MPPRAHPRPWFRPVAALALALLGALVAGALAADADAGAHSSGFRVLTFNVRFDFDTDRDRWAQRVALVAGLIQDARASVACLQEDKKGQVEDLRAALPGWQFVGVGRDGSASERCSVAFDTAAWRLAATGDFWLSDTPEKVGSNTWGCKYPHKVTWARLGSRTDPAHREVYFLSTHLDEHRDQGEVRRQSALVIQRWLAAHAREQNVILCGDFNAAPDEAPHAVLGEPLPGLRLRDAWEAGRPTDGACGTIHGFTGRAPRRRIDWIFFGGPLALRDVAVDRWNRAGHYPSDHFAVAAQFEFAGLPARAPAGAAAPQGAAAAAAAVR